MHDNTTPMCSMPGLLNNCSVVVLRCCCCCCASHYLDASFHSVLHSLHACAHTARRLQQRTCDTSNSTAAVKAVLVYATCMYSSLLVSLVEPYELIRDSRWCEHAKISKQQCNVLCWCVVYTGVTALYTIYCCLSCCWLQSVQGTQTHGKSPTAYCQH
jgi:hypothetical protein